MVHRHCNCNCHKCETSLLCECFWQPVRSCLVCRRVLCGGPTGCLWHRGTVCAFSLQKMGLLDFFACGHSSTPKMPRTLSIEPLINAGMAPTILGATLNGNWICDANLHRPLFPLVLNVLLEGSPIPTQPTEQSLCTCCQECIQIHIQNTGCRCALPELHLK